jgi:amidohydrolase
MLPELKSLIDAAREDVIRWRRHLHEHPELTFEEHETARYIMRELSAFPHCEISQLTPTSVRVLLKGAHPGKRIALRADIDALAVEEQSGVPFCSKNKGVMHACGHDAHTAMLMGAVKVLSQLRDTIRGEVLFLFQHAEEVPPGGAIELVERGALDGVAMIFGQHVWVTRPTGTVYFEPGAFSASVDNFDLIIKGKGAHGSMPHNSIDPIAVGAQVVTALQNVVSRRTDPLKGAVVTVATFCADGGYNVISDTVRMAGTVRSHTKEYRTTIPAMIDQTVAGVCSAFGAGHEMKWVQGGYPVGVNDPAAVEAARAVLAEYLPELTYERNVPPMFGGEDFAHYADRVPGCFFFLGCGNEAKGAVSGMHTARFILDEDVLQIGLSLHAGIIHHLLIR